jgi:hypothetical protein
MVRRSLSAIAIVSLLGAAPLARASPTLTLVWNDSYDLFPPAAVSMLALEVARLFDDNGMSVQLHAARSAENLRLIPHPRVNVIVMPSDGSRWGLSSAAMAATIGEKGGTHNIFVFYPRVLLGLGRSAGNLSPKDLSELSRAMARIVGHELIHVLVPELGHASSGLMSAELKRVDLLSKRIRLDPPSLRLAKLRLESWAPSSPAVLALEAAGADPETTPSESRSPPTVRAAPHPWS